MTNTRAEVTLKWADGVHVFALKASQVDELQRVTAKAAAGMLAGTPIPQSATPRIMLEAGAIGAIYKRLLSGEPLFSDVRESIRLGLIGGGMAALEALKMVETYIDNHPIATQDDIRRLSNGYLPVGSERDAASNLAAAIVIVTAAFVGLDELPKDDAPGEAQAGTPSGAATSTSRPSTSSGEPSNEPPQTSATSASTNSSSGSAATPSTSPAERKVRRSPRPNLKPAKPKSAR